MENVYDIAKYFIQKHPDIQISCFDSNMKLQKLLLFAYLVNLSLNNTDLFKDNIYAFEYGCVIGDVRLKFENNFNTFIKESKNFKPNFNNKTQKVLDITDNIFGNLSAKELSELNHNFEFWKTIYEQSEKKFEKSLIPKELIQKEKYKTTNVIESYLNKEDNLKTEIINGIKFYYDPNEITIDDNLLSDLYNMSLSADENAYTITKMEDEVIVY